MDTHAPHTPDPDGVGRRIREAREKAKLSISQLAGRCDCAAQTIRDYEAGNGLPSSTILARMALTLDVTSDAILGLPRLRGAS